MKKGFTLIELMVVVVIIGILAAIAIPNFISMQKRAKESSVKNNMHTLQLASEDFSTLTEGIYASDASTTIGAILLNADPRSIAGAAVWEYPIGPLNVLLPTSFKNPVAVGNNEGRSPTLATYAVNTDAGVVFYMSYTATGVFPAPIGQGVRYLIGGNGVDAVLSLTLSSGQ